MAEGYAATIFLLYALLILAHRSPPALTDFSDWTYEGILLRDRVQGVVDAAHVLKHYPVPNIASTVGIAALALLVSWHFAAKLWLCILLLAAFLASKHMMRTCGGSNIVWAIAPAAIFLNVNLWYGFINFQLGLCCLILIASLLLREERREWVIGILLVITFFCHMIAFAFAAVLLVLYARQAGRIRLLFQLFPGALLSAWYVFGRFVLAHNADGQAGMVSPVRNYSLAFWAYKINSYLKSFGFINPGTQSGSVTAALVGPYAFILLHGVNLLLCGLVGWFLVTAGRAAYRLKKKERFIWTGALLFLPLYLFAPGTALGISDPGSRVLQTVLAVTIFLLPGYVPRESRLVRVAAGCAIVLQIMAVVLFARVAFSPERVSRTIDYLPQKMVVFAHVPNHAEDCYLVALEHTHMDLQVFPTAMFLNTPKAETYNRYVPSCLVERKAGLD